MTLERMPVLFTNLDVLDCISDCISMGVEECCIVKFSYHCHSCPSALGYPHKSCCLGLLHSRLPWTCARWTHRYVVCCSFPIFCQTEFSVLHWVGMTSLGYINRTKIWSRQHTFRRGVFVYMQPLQRNFFIANIRLREPPI